jgi:3,4-dihydroxy-2-butanone 4-phosphate synthase
VATPETDGDLVEIARHATAAQLELIVRAYRGVLEVELGAEEPAHQRR